MSVLCLNLYCVLETRKEKEVQDPDLRNVTASQQKMRKIEVMKNHLKGVFDLNFIFV